MKNVSGLKRTPGPGRPKGAQNKATKEFKAFAQSFFQSKEWRDSAKRRIVAGRAPQLETYMASLLYGKPKEELEMSGVVAMPTIINRIRPAKP